MSNRITRSKGLFGALQVAADIATATLTATGAIVGASLNLGGNTVKDFIYGSLSVVHGTILPNRMGTIAVALAGLAVGDNVIANVLDAPANGLAYAGAQPAAGTLNVFVANVTTGTINPGTFSLGATLVDLT